jgi:hypothetical protein
MGWTGVPQDCEYFHREINNNGFNSVIYLLRRKYLLMKKSNSRLSISYCLLWDKASHVRFHNSFAYYKGSIVPFNVRQKIILKENTWNAAFLRCVCILQTYNKNVMFYGSVILFPWYGIRSYHSCQHSGATFWNMTHNFIEGYQHLAGTYSIYLLGTSWRRWLHVP